MLRVISNIVLWGIIALIVVLSIRHLVKEHQSGSCCECIGTAADAGSSVTATRTTTVFGKERKTGRASPDRRRKR